MEKVSYKEIMDLYPEPRRRTCIQNCHIIGVSIISAIIIVLIGSCVTLWLTINNQNVIDSLHKRVIELEQRIRRVDIGQLVHNGEDVPSPAGLTPVYNSLLSEDLDDSYHRYKREVENERRKGAKQKKERRRSRRKQRNPNRKQAQQAQSRGGYHQIDSIHFEAHVNHSLLHASEYSAVPIADADGVLTKEGFESNGKTFKFWRPVGVVPHFLHISPSGDHFTIEETGVYFIYAQVLFHDLSGRWAFAIHVDDERVAQCTSSKSIPEEYMSFSGGQAPSHGIYSHCYTAMAVRVEKKQRVSIRSLYHKRIVLTLGRSTFWGIIKLNDLSNE